MSRKYQAFAGNRARSESSRSTVPLALCFGFGLLAGCVAASLLRGQANSGLSSYLEQAFSALEAGKDSIPAFASTFWEIARWPLLGCLLGCTAFGPLALAALLAVRGFLLSYSVAVFVLLYGGAGFVLSAAVFGVSALTSVTTLFLIGQDVLRAHSANGKRKTYNKKSLLLLAGSLLGWLAAGTSVQHWLAPRLLRAAVVQLL